MSESESLRYNIPGVSPEILQRRRAAYFYCRFFPHFAKNIGGLADNLLWLFSEARLS
ncbi:hypothetical protein QLZ26_11230 [Cronobacter universalis]|uniref:hypothetical protein n=1 Tax=Cronobacter universalis TaxID=535744 RepID=UPI0024AF51BA|nr:hypothetical protein [Cronobacter universalis]ELY6244340.1 hypothetical protein [Cronobacter universalis]MDI7660675.1 hypothetical protein [Cronobacter universalis]